MKITFQIPEIFVVFSFVFLLRGMYWFGGISMGVGLFLALARFSLEVQRKKEEEANKIQLVNQVSEGLLNVFTSLSSSNKSSKFH